MRFRPPHEKQTQALLSVVAVCGSENNFVDSRAQKHNIESTQILALKKKGIVEEIEEVDALRLLLLLILKFHQRSSEYGTFSNRRGVRGRQANPITRGDSFWKTEIYIELIKKAFESHKRVLTYQRLHSRNSSISCRFTVAVNHSRFTPAERLAAWRESLERDEPLLVLGDDPLFMPLPDLGLIIVMRSTRQL